MMGHRRLVLTITSLHDGTSTMPVVTDARRSSSVAAAAGVPCRPYRRPASSTEIDVVKREIVPGWAGEC